MKTARLARYLRRSAPYLILLAAFGATALVLVLEFWAFLGPVFGALLGGILGVGNRLFGSDSTPSYQERPLDWRAPTIIILIFISLSIAIYQPVNGYRPLSHYILFGGTSGFIGYQIYIGQPRRQVLAQLVVLTSVTYWSTQLTYPAGAYAPDTVSFIPATKAILENNAVPTPSLYESTPTHMIYVAITSELSGLSTDHLYLSLSTCALICSVALVGYIDRVIKSIDKRTALFAALFFGIMGFTLRRGLYPNKMNFFKPLIVIVIISFFALSYSNRDSRRYVLLGILSVIGLVFGHTYSTGAAIMVITVIWAFSRFSHLGKNLDYSSPTRIRSTTAFVFFTIVVFLGYSLVDKGSLINRLASLILSTLAATGQFSGSASTGTSGGRYSTLSLSLLLFSTAGQMILFTLSVTGVSTAFDYREWSYDAINTWIATGMSIIGFSVFVNAVDIPTPRIYSLLGMFGLNIVMVIGILILVKVWSKSYRPTICAIIIAVFAILSLASPVAGIALSSIGDEVPHIRTYETSPNLESKEWSNQYLQDDFLTSQDPDTDIPLRELSATSATIDQSRIQRGQVYIFTDLATENGVILESGSAGLGGRRYVFLTIAPSNCRHSIIYSNYETFIYSSIGSCQ
ncbi:hypothetical protein [Halosimplex halophilum]|uniref:hypothetical protein n=1 Tax=Halosimplex halophilum TaxID=2559572 RepID=UPI00107F2FCB|nr:hypothetical protein [Halosimplex halophilum]